MYNLSPVLAAGASTFWAEIDPTIHRNKNNMSQGGTAHFNLIWSPVKRINTGVEYIYGKRTNVDGDFGEANRVQFMIKYIFP